MKGQTSLVISYSSKVHLKAEALQIRAFTEKRAFQCVCGTDLKINQSISGVTRGVGTRGQGTWTAPRPEKSEIFIRTLEKEILPSKFLMTFFSHRPIFHRLL